MKCADIEILISAYMDDEVNEGETRIVEEHLRQCESCREMLADFTELHTLSQELKIETAPPGFRQRVTVRLDTEPRSVFRQRAPKLVYAVSFSLLLLFSAAVIILYAIWQPLKQEGIEQTAMDVDIYAEEILFGQSAANESEIYSSYTDEMSVAEEILDSMDFGDIDTSFLNDSSSQGGLYSIRGV